MSSLAIILIVAAAGYGVARWTRLSVIPLLLLAGLGLSLFDLVHRDAFTEAAFQLGLAFLMFSAGIELNPSRFSKQLKAVLWVGLLQFLIVSAAGFGLSHWMGFDLVTSAYLGIALSTSSTLVVVSHLKQQQQMFEPFARLVIGVLLVQDLLMILVIGTLARWPDGIGGIANGLGGVLALGFIAVGCQRWVLPFFLSRLKLDEESLLLVVLALLFVFASLADQFNLPPVTGAFLAGFALARFPVNGVTRGLLLSLTDFFQAIFFITLGSFIVLPDAELFLKGVLLASVVVVLTPPLVALLAEWQGLTSRPAVESGLLLAQTSEFALVLGLTGSQVLNQITPETFSMIALVAVGTMTLTPFIATDRFTTFLLHFHPTRRQLNQEPLHKEHVLVLGFGASGMWAVKPLLKAGHNVLVVDDDPIVIEQLRKTGIPCIRGDGADAKVLDRAGAVHARLVLASMRRVADAEKVLLRAKQAPVLVRVFEDFEADRIRRLGGIPILNSDAAAETFMEWFEKTLSRRIANELPKSGGRPVDT